MNESLDEANERRMRTYIGTPESEPNYTHLFEPMVKTKSGKTVPLNQWLAGGDPPPTRSERVKSWLTQEIGLPMWFILIILAYLVTGQFADSWSRVLGNMFILALGIAGTYAFLWIIDRIKRYLR